MAICIDNKQDLQDKGVWTKFSGSEFLIVYAGNLTFQRKLSRLQKPFRKQIEKGSLDPEKSKELLIQSVVGTLLIDWKNVVDSSGNEIPFDESVAFKALSNNDDLIDYVQEFATDLENYREESIADEEKS